MKKIRFGILGYAAIAVGALIPALQKAGNACFYALASSKPESRAEAKTKYNVQKVYDTYAALLDDPEVDAVYIPLPNALHKEWAIKAMRKGKHVLCEKPMALTREDAVQMAQESQANKVLLMEAFMFRFHEKTRLVQSLVKDSLIGDIRHVSSGFSFVFGRDEDHRLVKEMGGGSFWDVGCYPINMVGMLMQDSPVSISAVKTEKFGVDFSLTALLQYASGAICTVSGGFDAQSAQVTVINGTKGSLLLRDSFMGPASPVLFTSNGETREYKVAECDSYLNQVEDFSGAIITGGQPSFSLEETVRNITLITQILEKAEHKTLPGRDG